MFGNENLSALINNENQLYPSRRPRGSIAFCLCSFCDPRRVSDSQVETNCLVPHPLCPLGGSHRILWLDLPSHASRDISKRKGRGDGLFNGIY